MTILATRLRHGALALVASSTLVLGLPTPLLAAAPDALVIDLVNEPSSLDPHKQWNPDSYYVYRNVFDNLLTRDDAGELAPQIATAWEYADDTEVVFTLRDDIVFHDGSPLTAADVVFSIERITAPDFGSPQLGQFDKITGATAEGEHTVRVTTDGAYPVLLAQLVKLSIVPKAVVEEMGDDAFNLSPVGSGPYRFEQWRRGVEVTLARNDDYWGEQGVFAKATFRAVPDASTRVANLQSGASHLVVSLDPDLAAQLGEGGGVAPRSVLTERVGYLKLNPAREGMDDLRLREAIAYAIDKELIVEGLLGDVDQPVDLMLTPVHFGWIDGIEGRGYDLDKAKALIEEIGEPARRRMEFATSPVFDQRIVQALQQMLTDAGLDVEVVLTDMSTYLTKVQADPATAPEMSFGRWSCACQDADGVLFPLLTSDSSWSSISDPEFDAPLLAARQTLDEEVRLAEYRKVHERVIAEVPLVPLYQASIIYGASDALDWAPTPNESLFLNRMDWSE